MPSELLQHQNAEIVRRADELQRAPMMERLAQAAALMGAQLQLNRNIIEELNRLAVEIDKLKAAGGVVTE